MIDPVLLTKKLISFPSITPNDAGAIEYLENLFKQNNFTCYIKEFGPDKIKNLYATYNGGSNFNLLFAGHIDVVEPGKNWLTDPFSPIEKNGKIYGRGAADMKGALAAMISAGINFTKIYQKSNISFLITADEEGEAKYGTKQMLKWMYENEYKIDFAIIGEPTCKKIVGDTIKIGRRGSLNCTLKILGKQGHVAYPNLAINPHNQLVKILNSLISFSIDNGNKDFEASNLEIVSIDTKNNSSNIIPEESIAKFNIRFNNLHTEESLLKILNDKIKEYSDSYILEHSCNAHPFLSTKTTNTNLFKESVYEATGIIPSFDTNGGTSDARFISKYAPLVEFGLLSSTAHKINEHIEILDLQRVYNVYYYALGKILEDS